MKNTFLLTKQNTLRFSILISGFILLSFPCLTFAESWNGKFIQYGKVRQVNGQRQHQGRILLSELTKKPHCYGVGSLPGLSGEATVIDSKLFATKVDNKGVPIPSDVDASKQKAALFIAAYVSKWNEIKVNKEVKAEDFEKFILQSAQKAGIDISQPFPFVVEGELINLKLHVINGACPVHAKRHKIVLPKENQPYSEKLKKKQGVLFGIAAPGTVGNMTVFGQITHTHAVISLESKKKITGHVEQVGFKAGTIIRFPAK